MNTKETSIVLLVILGIVAALVFKAFYTPKPVAYKPEVDMTTKVESIMLNSSVSIFSLGPKISSCSGVVVFEIDNNHFVLTAKHCIRAAEETYLQHNKATIFIASATDDLAIIMVDGLIPDKIPIQLSTLPLTIGTKINHIGFPTGHPEIEPYISSGTVTRISNDWNWATLESIPGCSGGGIFDKDGKLMGILWGGYNTRGNSISIFEPRQDIATFLTKVSKLINL